MMDEGPLFGPLPVPKRRRTELKTVPNRAWVLEAEQEESSVLSDEAEVAQALGILASAASFAEARTELEVRNHAPPRPGRLPGTLPVSFGPRRLLPLAPAPVCVDMEYRAAQCPLACKRTFLA